MTLRNIHDRGQGLRCVRPPTILTHMSDAVATGVVLDGRAGSVITWSCQYGYQLHGEAKSECLPNGQWSSQRPTCKLFERTDPRAGGAARKDYLPNLGISPKADRNKDNKSDITTQKYSSTTVGTATTAEIPSPGADVLNMVIIASIVTVACLLAFFAATIIFSFVRSIFEKKRSQKVYDKIPHDQASCENWPFKHGQPLLGRHQRHSTVKRGWHGFEKTAHDHEPPCEHQRRHAITEPTCAHPCSPTRLFGSPITAEPSVLFARNALQNFAASHGAIPASHRDMQYTHGAMPAPQGAMPASHGTMQTPHCAIPASYGAIQPRQSAMPSSHSAKHASHGGMQTSHSEMQTQRNAMQTPHSAMSVCPNTAPASHRAMLLGDSTTQVCHCATPSNAAMMCSHCSTTAMPNTSDAISPNAVTACRGAMPTYHTTIPGTSRVEPAQHRAEPSCSRCTRTTLYNAKSNQRSQNTIRNPLVSPGVYEWYSEGDYSDWYNKANRGYNATRRDDNAGKVIYHYIYPESSKKYYNKRQRNRSYSTNTTRSRNIDSRPAYNAYYEERTYSRRPRQTDIIPMSEQQVVKSNKENEEFSWYPKEKGNKYPAQELYGFSAAAQRNHERGRSNETGMPSHHDPSNVYFVPNRERTDDNEPLLRDNPKPEERQHTNAPQFPGVEELSDKYLKARRPTLSSVLESFKRRHPRARYETVGSKDKSFDDLYAVPDKSKKKPKVVATVYSVGGKESLNSLDKAVSTAGLY